MADTYEKDLAQKTSLTTSDFIRVVGSDNVSYKQGMTSVLNVFNLVFSSASDMDTKLSSLPQSRTFTFFSGANDVLTIFGTGSSSVRGILSRPNSTVVDFTLWTGVSPTKMYTFRMTLATHAITYQTEWPTRAEIDALNTLSSGSLTGEHLLSSLTYQKIGRICTVRIPALKDLAGDTTNSLCTLPEGYRPYNEAVYVDIGVISSSGFSRSIRIAIGNNGNVTAYLYGSTALTGNINVRALITYITA